jgi:hypothetical protein
MTSNRFSTRLICQTRPAKMIELSDDLFLGKGTARICYYDPRDTTRCIKIDWADRSFSQTKQEGKYYKWLAKNRPGFLYNCIPRFHGFVETNLGLGGVFDVVRDQESNTLSKSLRYYLQDGTVARERSRWEVALKQLRDSVLHNAFVVGDLGPGNILASTRSDGSIQLVIVDGIGHRDFLPLCDYLPALARLRSSRQMARFGLTSVESLLELEKQRKQRKQDHGLKKPE